MKKRIIAAIMAVAMAFGVSSMALAETPGTVVQAGSVVIDANSVLIDGGFETATMDTTSMITKVPTFTATEDNGKSTERNAMNCQVVTSTDELKAAEGNQFLLIAKGENLTIALPNLAAYKGGKITFSYCARAKKGNNDYGLWGRIDDRSVQEPEVDENGVPKQDDQGNPILKFHSLGDFPNQFNFWTQPEGHTWADEWTQFTQEYVIPDDVTDKSEYVINYGAYGNALYFDALCCVITDAQGATVDPKVFVKEDEKKEEVKKVTLKVAKKLTVKKGKKKTLKVTAKNAKKVTYKVSKKIVKLSKKSKKGVTIQGKKKGKTVLTVKADKKTAKCTITVK